jgi:non-ribosomal peptide synthetase component F
MATARSLLVGACHQVPDDVLLHREFEKKLTTLETNNIGVLDVSSVTTHHDAGQFVTYIELNRLANIAARSLGDLISARQCVDSMTDQVPTLVIDIVPSVDFLVAVLAALKLGLVYVPVDSHSAINRLQYILQVRLNTFLFFFNKTSAIKSESFC